MPTLDLVYLFHKEYSKRNLRKKLLIVSSFANSISLKAFATGKKEDSYINK
jgi:hypothetical protein